MTRRPTPPEEEARGGGSLSGEARRHLVYMRRWGAATAWRGCGGEEPVVCAPQEREHLCCSATAWMATVATRELVAAGLVLVLAAARRQPGATVVFCMVFCRKGSGQAACAAQGVRDSVFAKGHMHKPLTAIPHVEGWGLWRCAATTIVLKRKRIWGLQWRRKAYAILERQQRRTSTQHQAMDFDVV